MYKICRICKESHLLNEDNFPRRKDSKDGFRSECRRCSYYKRNKKRLSKKNKQYYENNKEYILKRNEKYVSSNRGKIRVYKRKYDREREKIPEIKLRNLVRGNVLKVLKYKKKNKSTFKHLPYTPQQLKEHLERQFEDWMSWNNHGNYDKNRKTWQIDHIYPQSKLLYDSIEHPNFQKCWALENLRPLEARKNLIKRDKVEYEK